MSDTSFIGNDFLFNSSYQNIKRKNVNYEKINKEDTNSNKSKGSELNVNENTSMLLRIMFIVIFIGLLLSIAFVVFALPKFEVKNILVKGNVNISSQELESWAGLKEHTMWAGLNCNSIESVIASHPGIEKTVVTKRFPNSIMINVTERIPVAILYAKTNSMKTEAHFVDKNGIVFGTSSKYEYSGLPVISGISNTTVRHGMRLPSVFIPMLNSLSQIEKENSVLLQTISEIKIVVKQNSIPEVLLFPMNYKLPVRMKTIIKPEELKKMLLLLDVFQTEGLISSIAELDLRTDVPVYRKKEVVN